MEKKFRVVKNGMSNAAVAFGTDLMTGEASKKIEAVQVDLQQSTSAARVMNIAIKLLALDWTDKTIDQVEALVDARLYHIATNL